MWVFTNSPFCDLLETQTSHQQWVIPSHEIKSTEVADCHSESAYYNMYSFILAIAILKAYLFYVVIELVSKLSLSKPFSDYVADKISKISYFTFSIGIISYIARETARNLQHRGLDLDILNKFWSDSEASILMAAIIYVIAQIFKRGIELQNENDLTV